MAKTKNNTWFRLAILPVLMAIFCLPLSAQEPDFQVSAIQDSAIQEPSVEKPLFEVVEADTIIIDSTFINHSPRKAVMFSAVLPGLGQIYNRKYWKLPIVYGGLGGFGYAAIWNGRQYNYYFDLYKYMIENDLEEYEGRTFKEVEWYKTSHLRYKNLFIIITIGFYAIQIVDASVDAHLIDYDISDDISLTVDPVMLEPSIFNASSPAQALNRSTFGLRCCLSF